MLKSKKELLLSSTLEIKVMGTEGVRQYYFK